MQNDLGLPAVIHTAYPFTTHVSSLYPRWEPRRFQVLRVRDLVRDPLSVEEYLRRPMTRRSRYLIRVLDLDRGVCRSVYQRSMFEWYRETPLRVGIFRGPELVELLRTNWGPSIRDRQDLVRFLHRYDDVSFGDCRMGVFSDDLEVITCDSLS